MGAEILLHEASMQRISILFVLLSLLALSACGGAGFVPNASPKPQQHRGTVTLAQMLSELDALKAPPGMGSAQFADLKQSLRTHLIHSGETKFTAAAPTGASNAVNDLTPDVLFDDAGNADSRVSWSYRNIGDYDQNSEVNVADLSALGAQLNKTTASPDWEGKAQYADGDFNGAVTIADITPLGSHLLQQVSAFRLESGASADGPWGPVETVDFSASEIEPSGQRMFTVPVADPMASFYRVVPIDGSAAEGVPSLASQAFVLSDKAEIVGGPGGVQFVSLTDHTLVLQAPDTNPTTIAVGDIIVGNDGDGYLWRVLSVEQAGNQITVTGEDAAITDLILKGLVDLSGLFAPKVTTAASNGAKVTSGPHELTIDCPHTDAVLGGFDVSLNALHFKFDPDLTLLLSVNGKADPDNPVTGFVTKLTTPVLEYWVDCALENATFNGTFPADPNDPDFRMQVTKVPFEFDAEVNGVPMQAKWTFDLHFGIAGEGDFAGTYQFDANCDYSDALFGGWWNPLQGWQDYNQFTSAYSDPDGGTPPAVTTTATGGSELRYYLHGTLDAGLFNDPSRKAEMLFQPTVELALTPTTTPSIGDLYEIKGYMELGRDFQLGTYGTQSLSHANGFGEPPQLIDSGFLPRSVDRSISGTITDGTNPLAGIEVGGGITGVPGYLWFDTTDANGEYTLSGITPGLNVTVVPDPNGLTPYDYTPQYYDYVDVQTHITGADFTAGLPSNWTHTVGFEPGLNESILGVAGDASGNTYVCGNAFKAPGADTNALIAKYAPGGQLLWSKQEGVAFLGSARFYSIAVNASGIYTVGTFLNDNTLNQEMLVVKWDADGNILWKTSWGFGTTSSGWASALDTSGNLYVGGECSNGPTQQDVVTLKYDSAGALLWQKVYTHSGDDYVRGGYYDAGNFYMAGHATNQDPMPSQDISLLKVFNNGNLIDAQLYDLDDRSSSGLSIQVDGSFNVYIGGSTVAADGTTSEATLLKLDSFNAPVAGRNWKTLEAGATFHQFNAIRLDGFATVICGGYWTNGTFGAALVKFDTAGLMMQANELYSAPGDTRIYGLDLDKTDGDLLIGGYGPNASGDWQVASTAALDSPFAQSAYPGAWLDIVGTINPPSPFTFDSPAVQDTGNGGFDALTSKRFKP
jgi:hypothetical protein